MNHFKVPAILLLCCLMFPAYAASRRYTTALQTSATLQTTATQAQLRAFEQQLLPYFEAKVNGLLSDTSVVYTPSQGDLFAIARYWKRLSSSFITTYLKALDIPSTYNVYISPGGNFEIYYSRTGTNAIDTTDTIGYSTTNWRAKTHSGNGVPDYVDMVAWAMDSTWSMEITRFGFNKPRPYIDATHTSALYKIVLADNVVGAGGYGVTYPTAFDSGSTTFYRSLIYLRNEWNDKFWIDTTQQPYMNYVKYPDRAVNVTAAHEFFHGVQYAMSPNQTLDNFPLSWLEGTAVLMESLGFDTVRDYIQYCHSYFSDPTSTIFNNDDQICYSTGLLGKYLYEKSLDTPSIAFVKNIFFNNYSSGTAFQHNLEITSQSLGKRWQDILGSFYTTSYFTGTRAKTGVFLKDAPLLDMWSDSGSPAPAVASPSNNATGTTLSPTFSWSNSKAGYSQTKAVSPFQMNWFSFYRNAGKGDTITLKAIDNLAAAGTTSDTCWSMNCIVDRTGSHSDTAITLHLNADGTAQAKIRGWSCIGVVANSNYSNLSAVQYTFNPASVHPATQRFELSTSSAFSSLVLDTTIADSSLTITGLSPNTSYFWRVGGIYTLTTAWSDTRMFTTATLKAPVLALPSNGAINLCTSPELSWFKVSDTTHYLVQLATDAAFSTVRIDTSVQDTTLSLTALSENTTYYWRAGIVYAAGTAWSTIRKFTTHANLIVYPNPASIKKHRLISFDCDSIVEISIYDVSSHLIAHAVRNEASASQSIQQTTKGYQWLFGESKVVPGLYYCIISTKDPITRKVSKTRKKLIVIP